jgi:hypothetical protein
MNANPVEVFRNELHTQMIASQLEMSSTDDVAAAAAEQARELDDTTLILGAVSIGSWQDRGDRIRTLTDLIAGGANIDHPTPAALRHLDSGERDEAIKTHGAYIREILRRALPQINARYDLGLTISRAD